MRSTQQAPEPSRTLGGYQMAWKSRARSAVRNAVLAGAAVALLAGPALAQKRGGSITFGLELDISGFDPLKVGVYDTAGFTAAALLFDTLTALDDHYPGQG